MKKSSNFDMILVSETSINMLPNDLLAQILVWLPINSVFRSKCVSKLFFSVISHHSFEKVYTTHQSTRSSYWSFILTRFKDIKVSWFPSPPPCLPCSSFSFDFLKEYTCRFKLLASDNGILLFSSVAQQHNNHQQYHVFNPLTKKLVSLPPPPRQEEWVKIGFMVERCASFFVVRVAPFFSPTQCLEFDVFSSETFKWCVIQVHFPFPLGFFVTARAVVYNGNFHWLAEADHIVVFDPRRVNSQCRLIASPGDHHNRIVGILGVSCGRLRYCEVSSTYHDMHPHRRHILSIWELEIYDEEKWGLKDEVRLDDIWPNNEYVDEENGVFLSVYGMFPEAFHPLDSDVAFLKCSGRLITYRISTRNLDLVNRNRNAHPVGSIFEWQSFIYVLPSWPIQLPLGASEYGKEKI